MALGSMDILTTLILPVVVDRILFNLLKSSAFFPLAVSCSFQCRDLSPLWLNLFLSILLFFDVIVSETISFISLLENQLLVYRNATDICTLTCPATLLNVFIRYKLFFCRSF